MARKGRDSVVRCPQCDVPIALNAAGSIPWHMKTELVPTLSEYLGVPEWRITEKCEAIGSKYSMPDAQLRRAKG